MKVDNMRKIDKWLGIPLCFLFSILHFISYKLFYKRHRKPDTRRTLFIELSEMGSAIIVDPAMRKLRREAGAELYFAIFRDNMKSLEILGTIAPENIFTMRSDGLVNMAVDVFRFMRWCRKKKITCVMDLELFSRFTALLCFLSGARDRIGFYSHHDEGLYRGNLINWPVRYNGHVHMAVNFVALINTAVGYHDTPYATTPLKPGDLDLVKATIKEEDIRSVQSKIRELYNDWNEEKLVLFNVNASDMLPQRRWLPENFAAVARQILDLFPDVLIIATGAPAEREYVGKVVNMVSDKRFVNSSGIFSFSELVPLYSLSTFMLTNDSGPAHFSAVTFLKIFVIFGPETPNLYLPLGNAEAFYLGLPCSPCVSAANHRKTTCTTRPCISTMPPVMISSRLIHYLKEGV